jgi:hypothetical protein
MVGAAVIFSSLCYSQNKYWSFVTLYSTFGLLAVGLNILHAFLFCFLLLPTFECYVLFNASSKSVL